MQLHFKKTARVLFFIVCLWPIACKLDPKGKLPNTPESVVVAWQRYIDLDQLDSARMLSTEYTLSYIAYLDSLALEETLEADYNPVMGLSSVITGDTAQCDFFFEDELGEKVPGRLKLLREAGQWKVDRVIDLEITLPDTLSQFEEQEMFQDSTLKN
jgi:hypothetical protein